MKLVNYLFSNFITSSDTFASKVAATQDQYADACVGNVTGSNAVNVFLGIGVAWSVAAVYWKVKGKVFRVDPGSLAFSVTLFTIFAFFSMGVLMLRRRPSIGGELGGPRIPKILTSLLFFGLWFLYILFSSLEAYCHIQGFWESTVGKRNDCMITHHQDIYPNPWINSTDLSSVVNCCHGSWKKLRTPDSHMQICVKCYCLVKSRKCVCCQKAVWSRVQKFICILVFFFFPHKFRTIVTLWSGSVALIELSWCTIFKGTTSWSEVFWLWFYEKERSLLLICSLELMYCASLLGDMRHCLV